MKRAAEEIVDMSRSLEASGFERRQSDALVKAIANSIEKFAITPDRLREILDESQQKLYDRIVGEMDLRFGALRGETDEKFNSVHQQFEHVEKRFDDVNKRFDDVNSRFDDVNSRFDDVNKRFDDVNKRFDDVNKRFDDTNRRIDALRTDQRADASRLFNLVLAMALGMAGVVGGLIVDRWF